MARSRREQLEQRLQTLKTERASWEPAWREITEQMVPYRAIWDSEHQRNRGDKKESKIINNTPVRALDTLAAGMMAGVTSPARQWFSLTTSDRELAEVQSVRVYLDRVQEVIESTLAKSNWYSSLSNGTYLDLGSIGTSAMFEEEGEPGEIKFTPLVIGQYYLDHNSDSIIDTCFREIHMTTRQMVQKFGLDKVSASVRDAHTQGNLNNSFRVVHAIFPNEEFQHGKIGVQGMRWASVWWESADDRHSFLRESGYDDFPILAPRWFVRPGDVYGRGPGWEIRGDCRSLQHKESRLLRMLDKLVDPPMRASANIKRASLLPGDVTHVPSDGTGTYEPVMDTAALARALSTMEVHIGRDERRIQEAMFVHLWQTLVNDQRKQRPTATEVEATRQEVMLMLGPLLENLDNDLLEPAIIRTFNILDKNDMLPLPPPEIQGTAVKVKFISIMHQMQQATGLAGIRTLIDETNQIASMRPDALDKLNVDVMVDELGRISGVRPDAVLSEDEVNEVRQARAEQEQQMQQMEQMQQGAGAVKDLSQADPQKLSEIADAISPVAAAQGGALGSVRQP
jgi:hypothetical protein